MRTNSRFSRIGTWTLALVAFFAFAGSAHATLITVDLTGAQGRGFFGDAFNTVILTDVGTLLGCPGCMIQIDAVSWDLGITAVGSSFYSDAFVAWTDSAGGSNGVTVAPGDVDFFAGIGVENFYDSGGLIDLIALGLEFMLLPDGILRIETYESVIDGGFPDAFWSGTVSANATVIGPIPEPNAALLFVTGFLVVGATLRKRTAARGPTTRSEASGPSG